MVSRLKGIETFKMFVKIFKRQYKRFGYGFPFEGNWNCFQGGVRNAARSFSLDMLSRLKGIETSKRSNILRQLSTLDMVSRLKGIETTHCIRFTQDMTLTLDMVSRLKGIETLFLSLLPRT